MAEVLDLVLEKVKGRLTDADREKLPSGTDVRWRNTAAWERFKMVEDGLLKSDSPRGTWELTEAGMAAAEADANQ
jgi:restriction endonuclease Mrr